MAEARSSPSPYISGPLVDSVFFIFTPFIGYLLGGLAFLCGLSTWLQQAAFGEMFVSAHLFAVFFRSHANARIFGLYPARFVLAPVVLFLGMMSSMWVFISLSVLAAWWDVYHSAAQVFGLGRIYDMKRGNPSDVGRRLDYIMCLYIYAGPILAGATLMDHVGELYKFRQFGEVFFTKIPAYTLGYQRYLTWAVLVTGIPYLIFYLVRYAQLIRRGYALSMQKALMYAVTAVTSVFAWGFNTYGEAFFVMNFFHAFQYYAIVWIYERRNIVQTFRLSRFRQGNWAGLALFLAVIFAWGYFDRYAFSQKSHALLALGLTVSLLHFWYDGFIWSVQKRQVT